MRAKKIDVVYVYLKKTYPNLDALTSLEKVKGGYRIKRTFVMNVFICKRKMKRILRKTRKQGKIK